MTDRRVAYRSAALLLAYPDERLVERLPLIRAALEEQAAGRGRAAQREPYTHLLSSMEVVEQTPVDVLARRYVEVFDLDRKHPLYLSYFTDGDTRRRGEVLAGFKQTYRDSGLVVDTHGELPDYLPMVLELAAHDPERGLALLERYRPSVELLRLALEQAAEKDEAASTPMPWVHVLRGVCATYDGPGPQDRAAAMAMAGPPTETVGLDSYDPRLLPLSESGGAR
ncbi:nitrate reductase molybdenum cofactor assembly chaperone [Mumia zhuanghuii]|uniref:Nitrate reductase molybdenum cofactor assembly chaperone n=1 Tax=Mumia zhuanghuii TaxID=2585211 RepID=A0A5C4MJL6_9ACTN|nr:nitrate reductase molybdenum cofactor assembly chaperone [Mumia zhuanghuii]TNC43610.1 nitrate reductase molybdenum cofactor assembly chaperone [Mumia zhuanghuii]TNC46676.1 nitrate reductase molybdenum cofactor assembly chaperone [Mumia zhuanghuii]